MKKVIVPLLVVVFILAVVSPALAAGKGPNGGNNGQGFLKHPQIQATANPDQDDADAQEDQDGPGKGQKPEKVRGNAFGKNGKTHGNPHGERSNFVLFGTGSVSGGVLSVTVESGNRFAQDFIGETKEIAVGSGTVIRTMNDDRPSRVQPDQLGTITGSQRVRVHGWATPDGKLTARQVTFGWMPDEAESELEAAP